MTRKTFLKILFGFFLVLVAGIGYGLRHPLLRRFRKIVDGDLSEKGLLTQPEFEIVRAVFEIVSPKPLPSIDELREFVNFRTSTVEGYRGIYRQTAAVLDSEAVKQFGLGFAALERTPREGILKETMQPQTTFFARTLDRLIYGSRRGVSHMVVRDLMRFYWSSGAGWASVGYSLYPGVPGPPRAYTSAPGSAARESLA